MNTAILVLGMHRSGTSALTGSLVKAGVAAPRTLMPAHVSNERGFFESLPFMAFHDSFLAAGGSCWHDFTRFDPQWEPSVVEDQRTRALALLREEFGEAELFALKDPRICRFAEFWLAALKGAGFLTRVVIPFRAPIEVAQSLQSVHGLSIEEGLLLWLRHVLDAERASRGELRSFVAMDEFLAEPRRAMARMGAEICVAWPKWDSAAEANIDGFLSKELKHFDARKAPGATLSEWAENAHEALAALSLNPRSGLARATLDAIAAQFEQACALFRPLIALREGRLRQVEAEAAALRADRDALAAQNAALRERRARRPADESRRGSANPSLNARPRLVFEGLFTAWSRNVTSLPPGSPNRRHRRSCSATRRSRRVAPGKSSQS
jgi:hypothetical protein